MLLSKIVESLTLFLYLYLLLWAFTLLHGVAEKIIRVVSSCEGSKILFGLAKKEYLIAICTDIVFEQKKFTASKVKSLNYLYQLSNCQINY